MHWRPFTYQVTPHLLCLSSFYCFLFLRHKTKTDHCRSAPSLNLKAMLSAKPLIWSWFLILMQIKLIFTRKGLHFASFCKREFLEVGNREKNVTSHYHGGKISASQQSFLTETAICIVKRWIKRTGYSFVFLPYLQNHGLLRARNFATVATRSNDSSFLWPVRMQIR